MGKKVLINLNSDNVFSCEKYLDIASNIGAEIFTIGFSVEKRPIIALKKGTGKIKVLFVSRIHGNEPATTQAMLEFFNNYNSKDITIFGILLANPDGAALFEQLWLQNREPHWKNSFNNARLNAAGVDLNRDWFDLSQEETRAIRRFIFSIRPDFVIDHHEFYWSDKGYPPKQPIEDEDGFMATMTDAPFNGVHQFVKEISKKAMYTLIEKLENDFQWKIKVRHFAGKSDNNIEIPTVLGIYLALRGIPKLLVETWGVGCSTLLLEQRIKFHYLSMKYITNWIRSEESSFLNKPESLQLLRYNLKDAASRKIDLFLRKLGLHQIKFKKEKDSVIVNIPTTEVGFIDTIHNSIFERKRM